MEPTGKQDVLLARANWMTRLLGVMRELGPYAAIGLILPGGSLIAFSLWVFRGRPRFAAQPRRALAVLVALATSLLRRSSS